MPPQDPTPLGDAMTHRFPEQKIPEPKPDAREDEKFEPRESSDDDARRSPIPDHDRGPARQRG
jgi:hypothetical protein